jgi:exodeoxyribonuclease-3
MISVSYCVIIDHKTFEHVSQSSLKEFPDNKLKLYHWGLNGIKSAVTNGFLTTFMKKHDPDIMVLTDTRIDYNTLMAFDIQSKIPQGYCGYYNNCRVPIKGKGATAILSKVAPKSIHYGLGNEAHREGGHVTTAEFEKFYIIAVHSPKSGPKNDNLKYRVDVYEEDLKKHIAEYKSKGKPVFIVGDFKVAHTGSDIFNPLRIDRPAGYTHEERQAFDSILETGFVDTFREKNPDSKTFSYHPMRKMLKTEEKGWRTDYILAPTDFKDKIEEAKIYTGDESDSTSKPDELPIEKLTDHHPIGAVFKI